MRPFHWSSCCRGHEVARLINDVSTDSVLTNTDVFPTFERTCTMELIEGGPFETIARAIRRWLDEERADGEPAPSWSEPDESREESSRAQARSIVVKLASFGSGKGSRSPSTNAG
jgi:hypothetical protein